MKKRSKAQQLKWISRFPLRKRLTHKQRRFLAKLSPEQLREVVIGKNPNVLAITEPIKE